MPPEWAIAPQRCSFRDRIWEVMGYLSGTAEEVGRASKRGSYFARLMLGDFTKVGELRYWNRTTSAKRVSPSPLQLRERVQNGVMFKREEGNTYTPITLTDGEYLATFTKLA